MLRIILIQPGSTDFDEQGRIKGSLDIPLSYAGSCQVKQVVTDLVPQKLDAVYTSPAQSAVQTATALAHGRGLRVKRVSGLRNLNQGLWHGKLIDEVRLNQPRIYRQCRQHPEAICPPEGEAISAAQRRMQRAVARITRKHRQGTLAIVIPEPLYSITRSYLRGGGLSDFWKSQLDSAVWSTVELGAVQIGVDRLANYGRAMTGA